MFGVVWAFLLLGRLESLTREVAVSGRVLEIASSPSDRVSPPARIAPGMPPLLAFRYYEGLERRRFTGADLMLDDAGH